MNPIEESLGITLIELLITIIILAILSSLAVPKVQQTFQRLEAREVKFALADALKQGKSQSYLQRRDVIFCLTDAEGYCQKDTGQRLLLFIDKNDNKHFDRLTEPVIFEEPLNLDFGSVHLRAGRRSYVKFYGDSGLPRGHFGHIKYCPLSSNTQLMYQVSFNKHGIIKFKPHQDHPTGCPP